MLAGMLSMRWQLYGICPRQTAALHQACECVDFSMRRRIGLSLPCSQWRKPLVSLGDRCYRVILG